MIKAAPRATGSATKPKQPVCLQVGVLSDTHGLLRSEVLDALRGSDHILHAGDIGDIEILSVLQKIAPVTAVRGNTDRRGPCGKQPLTQAAIFGGHHIYMLHEIDSLDLKPEAAGFAAVIFGHSHKPEISYRKDVLYFNPGSCGPRRFTLPVSLGFLDISKDAVTPRLVTLL
jgi:uncharacterized protein